MILNLRKSLFFLLIPLLGAAGVCLLLLRGSLPVFSSMGAYTVVVDAGHGASG